MTGAFVLVGGLFGLTLGSFLNVVVFRTPRHISVVRPGSFCPSCKAELTAVDNVPVLAWLWLRGKCRHCSEPISIRYPLVEAGTAVAFIGLAATIRPLWGLPGWWALTATLGVAVLIEAEGQVCPPAVTIIGGGIGVAALAMGAAIAQRWGPVPHSAMGLAAGIIASGVIAVSPKLRGGLGTATVWEIPLWGAALGWLGLTPALIGFVVTLLGMFATTPLRSRFESSSRMRWVHVPVATCLLLGLVAGVVAASLKA